MRRLLLIPLLALSLTGCVSFGGGIGVSVPIGPFHIGVGVDSGGGVSAGVGASAGPIGVGVSAGTGGVSAGVGASVGPASVGVGVGSGPSPVTPAIQSLAKGSKSGPPIELAVAMQAAANDVDVAFELLMTAS